MDDDEFDLGRQSGSSRKQTKSQGIYVLPSQGIVWIWKRKGAVYSGLDIRDVSAKTTLCSTTFSEGVKAASKAKGLRTNVKLPLEDLILLRDECVEGGILLNVVGGMILDDLCVENPCPLKSLELVLGRSCPWTSQASHRLEIESSAAKLGVPTAGATSLAERDEQAGSGPAQLVELAPGSSTGSSHESQIARSLRALRSLLTQWNETDALEHVEYLSASLEVAWQFLQLNGSFSGGFVNHARRLRLNGLASHCLYHCL